MPRSTHDLSLTQSHTHSRMHKLTEITHPLAPSHTHTLSHTHTHPLSCSKLFVNKRERDDVKLASDLRKMEKEELMHDNRNRNREGLEEEK